MSSLKKLAGSDAGQKMHNNEDARVIASNVPQKKDEEKGRSVKATAAKAAKAVKRIPYYIWLWEKASEAWDRFSELLEEIL